MLKTFYISLVFSYYILRHKSLVQSALLCYKYINVVLLLLLIYIFSMVNYEMSSGSGHSTSSRGLPLSLWLWRWHLSLLPNQLLLRSLFVAHSKLVVIALSIYGPVNAIFTNLTTSIVNVKL